MSETTLQPLRTVVIGAGAGVFGMHRPGLELPTQQVVGLTDLRVDAAQAAAESFGCPVYPDADSMLAEARPELAVVITPHTTHAAYSIAALRAGCHVLVEKPMAVHVGEADAMIAAAQEAGKLLAVNFQQRLRPEIVAAHRLIASGALGQIQHVDIKITWTRTAVYYRMSDWRGTWTGEGGAVLMNQGPHELDLLCYLVGRPARVYAWTRTLLHQIEAEDTVQAMVEWPGGALGTIHISTAEAGQPQRFEIIATGGHLAIQNGRLRFQAFDRPVDQFIRTHPEPFAAPQQAAKRMRLGAGKGDHRAIYQNLYEAIRDGKPLAAEGASGILGLELANAMNYSSYTGQAVEFPLDRALYAALLADLQAGRVGKRM